MPQKPKIQLAPKWDYLVTWLSFTSGEVRKYFLTHELQDTIGMVPIERLTKESLPNNQTLAIEISVRNANVPIQ